MRPITERGRASSTRWSMEARSKSASMEVWMPGTIAPPRYSPFSETQSKVVAVPKSTAITGPPMISKAATELTMRSAQGEYLGGAIFPGIHVSMEALFERASMLHRVELARPRSVIGRTTTASIQSGLLYGYAGLVDAMVEGIRAELGESARVVATGGLAQRIAGESRSIERVEPFLTLEGLRMLFEKNRPEGSSGPRKER